MCLPIPKPGEKEGFLKSKVVMEKKSLPLWKRFSSYFSDVLLETLESEANPELYVLLRRGRIQLASANAIYSFEDLYHNFKLAFQRIDWSTFPCKRVLVLGLGLGSIPQLLEKTLGKSFSYTAIEIDETVIFLAQKYILNRLESPMEIICADASVYCSLSTEQFDLITMDVFEDDQIPENLEDLPFLENLKKRLAPEGLLLYNRLARTKSDKAQTLAFYENTFKKVFPNAMYLPVKGNWILCNTGKYTK